MMPSWMQHQRVTASSCTSGERGEGHVAGEQAGGQALGSAVLCAGWQPGVGEGTLLAAAPHHALLNALSRPQLSTVQHHQRL